MTSKKKKQKKKKVKLKKKKKAKNMLTNGCSERKTCLKK